MIWMLSILLLGLFGVIGYFKGSIRMLTSLVGLFIAFLLAVPLGPLIKPLFTMAGMENLLWLAILPPVTAFLLVGLIFIVLGFLAHWKIAKYFKYSTDEATRITWERLNQRTGMCLGFLAGAAYTVIISLLIYIGGYLTVQVASDTDPSYLRFFNNLRLSLKNTGLDRMAASLDPVPDKYYQVADILGLSHRNPLLENRYRNYPPFLKLADEPLVQEMAGDDYHSLLIQQSSVVDLLKQPTTQKLLRDEALVDELLNQTDLKDLRTYLETGESPKYDEEVILGRWKFSDNAFMNHTKRNSPGIKARQIRNLKKLVENSLSGMSMIVYPDHTLHITAPESPAPKEEETNENQAGNNGFNDPYAGLRPGPRGGTPLPPGMSPETAARYGLPSGGFGQQDNQRKAKRKAPPGPRASFGGSGTWKRMTPGKYTVQINTKEGPKPGRADLVKDKLLVKTSNFPPLVFKRVY